MDEHPLIKGRQDDVSISSVILIVLFLGVVVIGAVSTIIGAFSNG